MFAADIYRPAEWHDFFVMVGGAAAVLTGLVFVALLLNLNLLLTDPMHRARSIGTLTNFGGVFIIAAIALMGDQTHVSIALAWIVVAMVAGFVYVRPWPIAPGATPLTLNFVGFTALSGLYAGE